MKKVVLLCLIICGMVFGQVSQACAAEQLNVYASVKESMLNKLHAAFSQKHPEITVNYKSGGSGDLLKAIESESEAGKVVADVLWVLEVPVFYRLKDKNLLEPYTSPLMSEVNNPFKDFDGSFTAVRMGMVGIAYNNKKISEAPKQWSDLTGPAFKDNFRIPPPDSSGAAYLGVVALSNKFGWDFIKNLHENGTSIGSSSVQVVKDVAEGTVSACLAVDYITYDLINKGAPVTLAFPPEMIVVPSPIAIIKGSPNAEAAKKFIDFMLSKEAQTIIANEGTLPVRSDVTMPGNMALPKFEEAMQRLIAIDYGNMVMREKVLQQFYTLMGVEKKQQ